jgi:hypothetical protein
VVDGSHIPIKTEELHSTGRQDDSFALSKLDSASIAVDRDAALQNRDEKMHILPAWAVPTTRQVDGASKHVEIVSARLRAVEVFRFWNGADRFRGTRCHAAKVSQSLKKAIEI